jgi:hypothetical protein
MILYTRHINDLGLQNLIFQNTFLRVNYIVTEIINRSVIVTTE